MQTGDAVADADHAPGSLMAEHRGHRLGQGPARQREVGVAHTRRHHAHAHLARAWVGESDLFDVQRRTDLAEHGGPHRHGSCSDLTSRNSSSPCRPSSRPFPDCL